MIITRRKKGPTSTGKRFDYGAMESSVCSLGVTDSETLGGCNLTGWVEAVLSAAGVSENDSSLLF